MVIVFIGGGLPQADHPHCDFCGECLADKPRFFFMAEDFEVHFEWMPGEPLSFTGEWWACGFCHGFIELEAWEQLHIRASNMYMQKAHPGESKADMPVELWESFRIIHQQFNEHRIRP